MKLTKLSSSLLLLNLFMTSPLFAAHSYKGEVEPKLFDRWTGFYAGLNLGVIDHTMDVTDRNAVAFLASLHQVSNIKPTIGLQLGYRQQVELSPVTGVYGLEVSAQFANATFDKDYGSPFALYQLDSEHKLKAVGLLELIGGIAANRTLLFLAGGLSWANITGSTTNLDSIAFFDDFSVKKNAFGTVLGAGIEYAFTEQLSARFKVDVIMPYHYSTTDDVDDHFDISNQIVVATLGINYQFA